MEIVKTWNLPLGARVKVSLTKTNRDFAEKGEGKDGMKVASMHTYTDIVTYRWMDGWYGKFEDSEWNIVNAKGDLVLWLEEEGIYTFKEK